MVKLLVKLWTAQVLVTISVTFYVSDRHGVDDAFKFKLSSWMAGLPVHYENFAFQEALEANQVDS